jgi:hypothetical protein
MSYRSYAGAPLTGYTSQAYGYAQTYMANDILALQTLYGADFTTSGENTVYSWSSTTGQQFVNGVAQLAPGNGTGGSSNRIFETVWDGDGIDTYDFSNYTTALRVNRNPGASSTTSATQIASDNAGNTTRLAAVVTNASEDDLGVDRLHQLVGDEHQRTIAARRRTAASRATSPASARRFEQIEADGVPVWGHWWLQRERCGGRSLSAGMVNELRIYT